MSSGIIAPSEIHSELSRIWDSLEGTNKMRASLFNLVFYTKKSTRDTYIRTLSERVIEKFPSRILFITEDTDENADYLNTRVSVLPSGKGESDIACDFIGLDVAGSHVARIPFVILPHLLPDLPIYVIWAEDPHTTSPLFTQLQKLATRMIFDSESITNLSTFAENLLKFEEQPQLDVADLNWARMESWRELITSTFYTEERLAKLKQATKIQIFYNSKETAYCCHTAIQSIYLQGWLATQLGWQLEKREENTFTYSRENGTVSITLQPEYHEHLKAGSIVSIDLETEKQDHFSFGRDLDTPNHVSMRFSTLEKCDMPLKYIFSKDESGQSLVKEICHKGTSEHYLNLLHSLEAKKEYAQS